MLKKHFYAFAGLFILVKRYLTLISAPLGPQELNKRPGRLLEALLYTKPHKTFLMQVLMRDLLQDIL